MSWPSTRLTDLCTVITKGTTPTTLGFEFSDRGIGFLRVQNINGGSVNYEKDILFIDERTHQALARSQIQPGDVLLSIAGTIGRTGVVPEDAPALNCNQALAILRTNGSVFRPFLRHWLESSDAQRQMLGATVTGTISNLSLTQIGNLRIPLPPLPEQRRIAEVLDRAGALRAKRCAALAQLDTLIQAIFRDLFSDGNDKQWETGQLKDVVRDGTIVTYGIVQAGEEFPGGIPYIRTGDIVEGEIAQQGLRHTDPLIASRFERSRVETGEIVVSIRATVGTTALVPPELDGANLTQGTARISPGSKVDRVYLLYWLRTPQTQHWISQQIKGATFREITLSRLRELPVTIPPIDLQQQFAAQASAVEKLKAAHQASLAEMNALFDALQYCAFRGEL
jgi:type I restriction enzyme S subunit